MVKHARNIILIIIIFFSVFSPVFSQTVDDLQKDLDKKNQEVKQAQSTLDKVKKEIESIKNSSASLDQKLVLIEKELNNVQEYVTDAKQVLSVKQKELSNKEVVFLLSKKQLNSISYVLYKTSRVGILDYFFLTSSSDNFVQNIYYKQYLLSKYINSFKDKRVEYAQVKSEKLKLESDKKELESSLKELEKLESDLLAQKNDYQYQIATRNSVSSSLKNQITLLKGQISNLQVSILAAKSGGYLSADDVPAGGSGSLANFNSQAKPGDFGVFSYGAFTHRNGMSQWGARARADSGQLYDAILKAYYPGKKLRTGTVVIDSTTKNLMTKIKTTSGETLDFENEYLMRLGEMPESWDLDALKAQAIAARTYAVNYTSNGSKAICITQSCQVILANKKTGNWKKAVEQTKGVILTNSNGTTFSAQYAAVHGGWVNNVGWDTTDKKGEPNAWEVNAWDNKSGVSWFYQAWSALGSKTCASHPKPWLTNLEMADLLNTYLVRKEVNLTKDQMARILPVTLPYCQIDNSSGNPYSVSEMKSLIKNPVTSVTGVKFVQQSSSGTTSYIYFDTVGRGEIKISGSDFKEVFNMRAPGYLSIPQNNFVFIDVLRKS